MHIGKYGVHAGNVKNEIFHEICKIPASVHPIPKTIE
jgi:hypothetical protein